MLKFDFIIPHFKSRKARACDQCYNAAHATDRVTAPSQCTLDSLGSNVLELILAQLPLAELGRVARVSQRWNAVASRDGLWLAAYRRLLLQGTCDLTLPVIARGTELARLR